MNVSPKFIDTSPDKVIFKKAMDDRYTAIITINNLIESVVVFQVFLNKQASYSVIPSVGYIEPYGSTEVIIRHVEERFEVNYNLN
jgi:hypothetical protein